MWDFVRNLPVQSVISGVIAGRFWFCFTVFLLILNTVQPSLTIKAMKTEEKVIGVNEATGELLYCQVKEWRSADTLFKFCAKKSVTAYVMRNPKGLDDPELAEVTFNTKARAKIKVDLEKQSLEFADKQIHQKGEILEYSFTDKGETEIENEDGVTEKTNVIEARVTGQLIRTGIQKGIDLNQKLRFSMVLTMLRNKSIKAGGMFPLVTTDYQYEETPL